MSYYVIAALGLLAAWFFALYERAKAKASAKEADEFKKQAAQAQADSASHQVRYEALVADLKAQLKALEASYDACATPDSLRARFRELFPLPAEAHPAGPSVPPDATPAPGAGKAG